MVGLILSEIPILDDNVTVMLTSLMGYKALGKVTLIV
jgi:hypothetical protein